MLNRVMLIGNLGADPEVRRMNNGDAIVNMRVATSENWTDKQSGERKSRTEWHTVVIFNEQIGKIAEQYLRKGSKCFIEGSLQTRKWQDKEGKDRYSTEIVLQRFRGAIELLDGANGGGDRESAGGEASESFGRGNAYADRKSGGAPAGAGKYAGELDDDIPF
jgi:single-strand DNA-binding protein